MRRSDRAARTGEMSRRDIALFTELTGDEDPLHDDDELAFASRFGTVVVQGGITSGLLDAVASRSPRP